MKTKILTALFTLSCLSCMAIDLSSLMSEQEQTETGYSSLTKKQKKELNLWLSKNVTAHSSKNTNSSLSLNINSQNGKQLILSDGTKWDVSPDDQKISSVWLTPIPLSITPNTSKDYPYTLMNQDSKNEIVKVKPSS
jgi:hypothetical protein